MLEGTLSQTFEETYKQSYSHGLEAIYALENVDVKSIRRLNTPPIISSRPNKTPQAFAYTNQLEMDFGKGFRKWIIPCVFLEPIQVLELPRFVEKILWDHGKKRLSDLRVLGLLKGMGPGHLEEIKIKLGQYLKGKDLLKTHVIDFGALIRSLVADGVRKKMAVCLKVYGLDPCVSLLPSENMELRRLTQSVKEEWIKAALDELQMEERTLFIKQKIEEVAVELIKPWIRGRFGIATEEEILERVEGLSLESVLMDPSLQFLSDIYYSKQFLFSDYLYEVCPGVYCADAWQYAAFHDIILTAKTYFYKPGVCYHLTELVGWLNREFAKRWVGFPEGMLEKVLRLFSEFCLWKGVTGKIEIAMA